MINPPFLLLPFGTTHLYSLYCSVFLIWTPVLLGLSKNNYLGEWNYQEALTCRWAHVGCRSAPACCSVRRCLEKECAVGKLVRNRKTDGGTKLFTLCKNRSLLSNGLTLCNPMSPIWLTAPLGRNYLSIPYWNTVQRVFFLPAHGGSSSPWDMPLAEKTTPILPHSKAGRGLFPCKIQDSCSLWMCPSCVMKHLNNTRCLWQKGNWRGVKI